MRYMLTSNEERIAAEWEKYQGYTVRPLPSTVAYYQRFISQQKTALLYGGTPEIRSLFQARTLPLVILDINKEMVHAMGRLTPNKLPLSHQESLLTMNWLATDSLTTTFDLLMADDAINMVRWDDFDLFLRNAHALLQADGLFICHLLVKPDDVLIYKTVDDIFDEYKHHAIPSLYDLASRLNFICYDHNHYSMGWQQTITMLGKEKLNLFKPDFDFINTFKFCNSRFYCPPQAEFEAIATLYFHIEELFYPHEYHYCRFEPIYVLRKRGDKK